MSDRTSTMAAEIGQAVHELTTNINHRLARPWVCDDCAVLGRIIADRVVALAGTEWDLLAEVEETAKRLIAFGVSNRSREKYAAKVALYDTLDDALEALDAHRKAQ